MRSVGAITASCDMDGEAETRLDFIIAAQPMMGREPAAEGNSTLKRRIRIRTRGQLEAPDRDDTQIRTEQSDTTRQRKPTAQLDEMKNEEKEHVARIVASLHASLIVLSSNRQVSAAGAFSSAEATSTRADVSRMKDSDQHSELHKEHAHVVESISNAAQHRLRGSSASNTDASF